MKHRCFSAPVRFGPYELDPVSGELRKRGLRIRLSRQSHRLLQILLEPPLRAHTRAEIREKLWPDGTFVDFERGINKVVHSLRESLGESAASPRYIETVATEGYRFTSDLLEWTSSAVRSADPSFMTVAVLPIQTEPDGELSFLARRVYACLLGLLAVIPEIKVLGESACKTFELHDRTVLELGRALGVQGVITGGLIRHAEELLLSLELVDCDTGYLVFGTHALLPQTPNQDSAELLAGTAVSRLAAALRDRNHGAKEPQSASQEGQGMIAPGDVLDKITSPI